MEPKKLKRMIYIYEENLEFYDALDNKSSFINELIFREKKGKTEDKNLAYVREKIAAMDEKRVKP